MKKIYLRTTLFTIIVLSLLTSVSCNRPNIRDKVGKPNNNRQEELKLPLSPEQAQKLIEKQAKNVILAIKSRKMDVLAKYVDPERGLRFSPYAFVHIGDKEDIVFSASQIKQFFSDRSKYVWGVYNGSGEPIEMTPEEYFNRFVYNVDFATAKSISYNKILGHGNVVENQFTVYPKSIIVEYYFPGFDPKYEGMDWQSLRLVFERSKGVWYLIGIIHNEWTI